jgi:hypothetical protein
MLTSRWRLAAFAAAALASYGGVVHAASPPFNQCPAIGASPSCAVLITINPGGSLSFQQDPSVKPFDGIDDQLVGVVNNSGTVASSISLSGPDIFGFDGDGAGSVFPGGPFGSTGYEGPQTNFAITDVNNGTVLFLNGLPNDTSRWFSLEGPPHIPTVGINKDLLNNTGQPADEIRIVLAGAQTVVSHYDGPGAPQQSQPDIVFGTFSSTVSGGNTILDWKAPNAPVLQGYIVHVGFTINSDFADLLGITWLSNGVVVGCAPQVPAHTHQWGDPGSTIIFSNTATQCTARPLFVGNMTVNWYNSMLPVAQLRPDLLPKPIRSDNLNIAPVAIQPGKTAQIPVSAQGPQGAVSGVLLYDVGGSSSLEGADLTHDVLQFPAFPPTAPCTSNSQCQAGEICQLGNCVAPPTGCTSNSQCSPAQACIGGICVVQRAVPAAPPWALTMLALVLGGLGFFFVRARSLSRRK